LPARFYGRRVSAYLATVMIASVALPLRLISKVMMVVWRGLRAVRGGCRSDANHDQNRRAAPSRVMRDSSV